MEPNTRQEVAEAIRARTGEDVSLRLHDECLARYEALPCEERLLLLERAIEDVLAAKEVARSPEEDRAKARECLETAEKVLHSPHLSGVTDLFMAEVAMLRRIVYSAECPLKFRVDVKPEEASGE